jgi:hypothetical protein
MKKETLLPAAGALAAAGAAYALWFRPWHLRWGATEEEIQETLPGDEIVPDPAGTVTHAITIHAPVDAVWPWLAQIGQDKGGFYSYTALENLVGCHMRNAGEIVPEWQDIKVGDSVWLHPKVPPLPVMQVEPGRALVLGSNTNEPGTWGLYLKPIDADTTRLIVRGRWDWKPNVPGWIGHYLLLEPAHFVMERKMMLGIKERAETLYHRKTALPEMQTQA